MRGVSILCLAAQNLISAIITAAPRYTGRGLIYLKPDGKSKERHNIGNKYTKHGKQ